MKERPIVIITICYIISIIWGIYFKKYIPLFCLCLFISNIINARHSKELKAFINGCIVFILISAFLISYKDKTFYDFVVKDNSIKTMAVITEVKPESEYYYNYVVNTKSDNKRMNLMIKKKENAQLDYADYIYVEGEFEKAEPRRNFKGFSAFDNYKQRRIYGTIKCENCRIIKHKSTNAYNMWINGARNFIKQVLRQLVPEENLGIANALLLGDSSEISDEEKMTYSNANLSHILAISGMHVSYVILGLSLILKKVGKRSSKLIFIVALILFASITGRGTISVKSSHNEHYFYYCKHNS